MGFIYFDSHHAIIVHDNIINISGGKLGLINPGLLDSTLAHLKNEEYYPTIEHKICHLFFSINKNHIFVDGNKRSSLALSSYFLEINGLSYIIDRFIKEMENIAVDVCENRIDKPVLHKIVYSLIYEDDYSEELKLIIVNTKTYILS